MNNNGVIFAPYIISQSVDTVINSNFTSKRLLRSRYSIVSIYDQLLIDRKNKLDKIINRIKNGK